MTPLMSTLPQPASTMQSSEPTIAVVLPCYNEAACIGQVIQEFKAVLPEAVVHVFDNASTDGTAAVAKAHGAQVHHVALRGKGNVIRRMFADVEADIYVMTDGDATYDASNIREMIEGVHVHGCDMVVGVRVDDGSEANYRAGHRLGNRLLTGAAALIFGGGFTDMLSGHRVFSRRYAKSFPAMSHGFETETELTVHALGLRMPYMELPVAYRSRPEGSVSKLSTYRDGWRILRTILGLFTSERPLVFYSLLAAVLALTSVALAQPLVATYLQTGQVPRFPTAILSTGMMISAFLSLVCGVLLRNVTLARQEAKRLVYLAIPSARRG